MGLVAGVVAACVELQGSLGSDCLNNRDCQSGVCSQLHCAETPPLFEFEAGPDAGPDAADGASMPAIDGQATTDAPATNDAPVIGADGNMIVPDGGSNSVDAAADAIEETPGPDAPQEAPSDAAADARLDGGDAG
jgi:hypothetical protein